MVVDFDVGELFQLYNFSSIRLDRLFCLVSSEEHGWLGTSYLERIQEVAAAGNSLVNPEFDSAKQGPFVDSAPAVHPPHVVRNRGAHNLVEPRVRD